MGVGVRGDSEVVTWIVLGPVGGGSGFPHLSLGLTGRHPVLDFRLCPLSMRASQQAGELVATGHGDLVMLMGYLEHSTGF